MVQATVAEQLLSTYAKPTGNQSKPWSIFEKDKGCIPVKNSPLCLRTDKAPPSKTKEKPKKEVFFSTAPPPPKEKGWSKMFSDFQKLTQPAAEKEQKLPPPFDLRDIPGAMRKMGWSVASTLAQRWLDGRAHVTPGKDAIFPADMVDATTVKFDWLLSNKGVKAQYDTLFKNDKLFSFEAQRHLKKSLYFFLFGQPFFYGTLDTFAYCKGDIQQLHKQFQFQFQKVSTWAGMHQFGMTDVTAGLGAFNFCAAIARAYIENPKYYRYPNTLKRELCSHPVVTITHIYVYAKDIYSFEDTKGKSASQYLGHWNKTGVIVDNVVAAVSTLSEQEKILGYEVLAPDREIGNSEWSNYVVDTGSKNLIEKEVFYPVRNRDYRTYREKQKHGGDFVIYSDLKLLKLNDPIKLDLGEICS